MQATVLDFIPLWPSTINSVEKFASVDSSLVEPKVSWVQGQAVSFISKFFGCIRLMESVDHNNNWETKLIPNGLFTKWKHDI